MKQWELRVSGTEGRGLNTTAVCKTPKSGFEKSVDRQEVSKQSKQREKIERGKVEEVVKMVDEVVMCDVKNGRLGWTQRETAQGLGIESLGTY